MAGQIGLIGVIAPVMGGMLFICLFIMHLESQRFPRIFHRKTLQNSAKLLKLSLAEHRPELYRQVELQVLEAWPTSNGSDAVVKYLVTIPPGEDIFENHVWMLRSGLSCETQLREDSITGKLVGTYKHVIPGVISSRAPKMLI